VLFITTLQLIYSISDFMKGFCPASPHTIVHALDAVWMPPCVSRRSSVQNNIIWNESDQSFVDCKWKL